MSIDSHMDSRDKVSSVNWDRYIADFLAILRRKVEFMRRGMPADLAEEQVATERLFLVTRVRRDLRKAAR